jgi:hypothetical protein
MTAIELETIGNATLLVWEDSKPVLATDPWLTGTCYFGSWAHDRNPTAEERGAVAQATTIWISHGHPDHLHAKSLDLLSPSTRFLVPDHYNSEILQYLREKGFNAELAPYRKWIKVSPSVRIMSLDNENQDAILLIEAGDTLIVNQNDSPWCGEFAFVRSLVKRYGKKSYLAQLCAIDADMLNIVNSEGQRIVGPPEERKPGAIWAVARMAQALGVANFLCSSSQHIYVRADSVWANPYRITWGDMQRWWNRRGVRLIEPFVKVNLTLGTYERKHPSQTSNFDAITDACGEDDWLERLSLEEWGTVEAFIRRFETIRRKFDFIEFVVGGERRRFVLSKKARSSNLARGVTFHVPRISLMKTAECGYFDDLLIGNFMKTELHNTALYPNFSPRVAKLGGNAKVYTAKDRRRFLWHYARRNLYSFVVARMHSAGFRAVDLARRISTVLGIKAPLKFVYRWYLGDTSST